MEQKGQKSQAHNLTLLTVQSLALFTLTYYASFLLSGLSVLYIAYDFDIQATLYLNHIEFLIPENSRLWSSDAIISVLMATPVSSFVLGIVSVFIFILIRKKNSILLYGSVWLFLQAFNHTFGLLGENLITQSGLFFVAKEMEIESIPLIMTFGVSVFLLVKSGIFSAKLVFTHAQPEWIDNKKLKIRFTLLVFIFPWLIGSIFIMIFSHETTQLRDFILSCFMLILLIPAFFVKAPEMKKEAIRPKLKSVLALFFLTIIFFISINYFLSKGISFW